MKNLIKILPSNIINQIAAGEVVQRPSSVVKELIENSIDANSSVIKLIIKDSGKTLIQVCDNGIGMSCEDAQICFEKHATSKITSFDDLYKIKTMGFRGEALSSIASVSNLEMETSLKNELGIKIFLEGGVLKQKNETHPINGTSISVKNLFFNVPARRNFLKSDLFELKNITCEFIKIAIGNPEINFVFYHNDKEIFNLPSKKLNNRILDIFGNNYQKQLIPCKEDFITFNINGYLGNHEFLKKNKDSQFLFVNKRYIKNAAISSIIKNCYNSILSENHFPFFVLFFEIDPKFIDINIHPNKSEIKFQNEDLIFSSISSIVKKSLFSNQIIPILDFKIDTNFDYKKLYFSENFKENKFIDYPHKRNNKISEEDKNYSKLKNYDKINEKWNDLTNFLDEKKENLEIKIDCDKNIFNEDEFDQNKFNFLKIGKFIVFELKNRIIFLNLEKAYKKFFFEKERFWDIKKQKLIFPIILSFSPEEIFFFKNYQSLIYKIGFDIEISQNKIAVSSTFKNIDERNLKIFFENFLNITNKNENKDQVEEKIEEFSKNFFFEKINYDLNSDQIKFFLKKFFKEVKDNFSKEFLTVYSESELEKII
jgi:DNA mismatch repair protein MutL